MPMLEEFVSRESYERLKEYINLLLKWNKTINLIADGDADEVLKRHVLDSLQLLRFIQNKDISIIDLGSGSGLPGIVLSIAGVKQVTLLESDSRKAVFLLQASRLSNNAVEIINERLEDVVGLECDIVTARAFADLNMIFYLSSKIKVRDKYLLHKGKKYKEEIEGAGKHWLFNSKVHDSITSDSGKILEITDLKSI
jgi:16S rRNA (guanine527-N7)-methyltransferase